ncbi:MAG: endonuclease VII domain-containing protein [Burkholderiales bacterium]
MREWLKNNRDKANATRVRWIAKNPEKHEALRKRLAKRAREKFRRDTFGTDGNDLFDAQDGRCDICRQTMIRYARGRFAAQLDHDHDTGKLRGWLCRSCNLALGLFEEDLVRMQRAIEYIVSHRCQHAKSA